MDSPRTTNGRPNGNQKLIPFPKRKKKGKINPRVRSLNDGYGWETPASIQERPNRNQLRRKKYSSAET